MFANAFKNLDSRRWFDRMFPQTLSIAMFLLYIDGAFALLSYLDRNDIYGAWRIYGGPGALIAPLVPLAYVGGAFLMANGKLLGWYVAIGASFGPLTLRIGLKVFENHNLGLRDAIFGGSWVGFAFEAALVALLLHPMSRQHVSRWLR